MRSSLRHNIRMALLICLLTGGLFSQSQAQDWPQWRGPARDGAVTDFTAPPSWPDDLQLGWKITVGIGHASPVIKDGRVYLHSRLDDQEVASCFDLNTGDLIWRTVYPAPYEMHPAARDHGKGPKSTPVIQDGMMFTLGISGILSGFDVATGALKWQQTFTNQYPTTSPWYGTAMSPVVDGDLLFAHVGGHDSGALTAFDTKTGAVRWRWDEDGPAYTSPIVVEIEATKQIVTQTQSFCVGISVETGQALWRIPFTTPHVQNSVTPIVAGNALIFSGLEQGTMAIQVKKDGNGWSTEKLWHNQNVSMYMSSPVLSGDRLFGMSHLRRGQFFSLDTRTGSVLWTSEGRRGDNAAILMADQSVLFLTTDAELTVVKNTPDGFEQIKRYTVADSPTWAHPAMLKDIILIKDVETLTQWRIRD